MKLNLPSIWNLLFLNLIISLSKTDAGSQFSKCLRDANTKYQDLISFANNIPDKERFCCCPNVPLTNGECHYSLGGGPNQAYYGQCNSIGQTKFCVTNNRDGVWTSLNFCGGILANSVPTNATVGTCPSFSAIGNIISRQSTTPTFSWLCCDDNNCLVPVNVNITDIIATTNCPVGQYSLMCFQDNGGWTCAGSIGNAIDITQPIGSCVLQV